ncbi:MAG: HAD family hydrolase [Lachnospiraceae bacterium]|nr:HAD family hydrolase [Lachnospiraceae bacterium]
MKYEAILFDLDGTLLPMDNDQFTYGYMKLLAKTMAPYGYQPETLIQAVWKGVSSMVKNDGSRKNSEAFWETFTGIFGPQVYEQLPVFDRFYREQFQEAAAYTAPNPLAKEAVKLARQKAAKVILATNPLFPPCGVETRLSWIGLKPEDFDYVTNYENSCYCKPNPKYFEEISVKQKLKAQNCLMIGNDVQEDVEASNAAGLDCYLVTDNLINRKEMPECKRGSFEELISFLEML